MKERGPITEITLRIQKRQFIISETGHRSVMVQIGPTVKIDT